MDGAGMVNRYANPGESSQDYRTDDQRAVYTCAGTDLFYEPFRRYLFPVSQTARVMRGWLDNGGDIFLQCHCSTVPFGVWRVLQ